MIFWAYALEYCHKKMRSTEANNYQKMTWLINAMVTVTPYNQGSSLYLSNDILNQLVHGKCDVSMYTKHLTTCILEVGGVHITWNQSKQKEHMHYIPRTNSPDWLPYIFPRKELLSNSENREHLKNFRNVDCVLANYNKVQDTQAYPTTTN